MGVDPAAKQPDPTRLERIVRVLQKHGVEFVVIGGEAGAMHGNPLPTFDTDLCYGRSEKNLRALEAALKEIGVELRGAPPGLPFKADFRTLVNGSNFTFTTPMGDLDLLGYVEPIGAYEQVVKGADRVQTPFGEVLIISLDDLIRIKRHLGRPKDLLALQQLEAIKHIRDEKRS